MQIVILRKNPYHKNPYAPYDYSADGFNKSASTFIVELFQNHFFTQEVVQWLQQDSDEISIASELWTVTKREQKIYMEYYDEFEETLLMLSVNQLIMVIQEFIRLKNLNYHEIVYLFASDTFRLLELPKSESVAFAYTFQKIIPFSIARPLNALSFMLTKLLNLSVLLELPSEDKNIYSNDTFSILYHHGEISVQYHRHGFITKIPYEAFIWTVQTYQKLIKEPFEQLLFYRTPEKYVFMRDMDEEIIFEI